MRKLIAQFLFVLTSLGIVGAIFASAAFANTPDNGITASATSVSYGSVHLSTQILASVSNDVHGKINVEQGSPTPLHPSHCIHVKNPSQRKGHTCIILPVGFHFLNGWLQHNGHWIYLHWTVTAGDQKFVLKSDGWHKASCNNRVKLGSYPNVHTLPKSRFHFWSHFSVRYHVKVCGTILVTATATASCNTGSSTASAGGHGSASGHACLEIWISASSSASAQGIARGKLAASVTTATKINGKGTADINAKANASASVHCSAPVTPTPTPTPSPAKPTVSATTLNDLEQGQHSDNFCISANLPTNDAGTITLDETYGSFKTAIGDGPSISSISVTGVQRVCVVYYAPNDSTATSDLTEHVTVNLVDNATHVTADTYYVPDFQIKVPASHP